MSNGLEADADCAAIDVLSMTRNIPTSQRLVIASILVIREAERQYGKATMDALKNKALAIDALMDAVMEAHEEKTPEDVKH